MNAFNSLITITDNDELFYKFYGHNENDEYLNNISSIPKGNKYDSFSIKESYTINWNIKDTNNLLNFKNINISFT